MDKEFEEFLRSINIDPTKVAKGSDTEKSLRAAFDQVNKSRAAGGEVSARAGLILGTARAAAMTAEPALRAGVLEYAAELVAGEVSAAEAQRKIAEKVTELAAELAKRGTGPTGTAHGQQTVPALPTDRNAVLSRSEIVCAFADHGGNGAAVRHAANSVCTHMAEGDEVDMRGLVDELKKRDAEGNRGQLRVHDEQGGRPTVRTVTASSANVAIQNVLTVLLNKQYALRPSISSELVTTIPSAAAEDTLPEVETEDGVARVREGQPYPILSGTERDVKVGHFKFGAAIAQTRENNVFDRLGRVAVHLSSLARQLSRKKDTFTLARVCDSAAFDGRYIGRPGNDAGSSAFYTTTPDERGNLNLVESNGLANETDIDNVIQRLDAMKLKDGSFVVPEMRVLLVPSALKATAWKIVNSIYAPSAVAATGQPLTPNPYGPGGMLSAVPRVISHPLVATYAGASTTWFAGDPQQQFFEKEVWPVEVVPQITGGDMALRDIVGLWIGSFCCDLVALSNMYFVKNTA